MVGYSVARDERRVKSLQIVEEGYVNTQRVFCIRLCLYIYN